jgi:hypothetical protein
MLLRARALHSIAVAVQSHPRRPQASHLEPATPPLSQEGMMELLIGFVTTLFISLLIFRK